MTRSISGRDRIALAAICLSSLMFGLEISSVPTILPTLETVLHADFPQLQWIMNAYTIAVTSVLMGTGTLADRYGRKRIFIGSILVFGLSSLVCGLAADAPLLIASRAAQGASGGAMLICQVAILSHQFPPGSERARAFSAWGIIFGLGLGFGPLVGAGIVALADWRWVFLVHVVLAAVTSALALRGVQESRNPDATHLDLAGILTLSLCVFCLAFYITQGPDLGFASAAGLSVLGLAILAFLGFLFAEIRSAQPMFDFSVFRIGDFSRAILGSMGMNFSFWPFMIYLPILLRSGLGYSNMAAGLALLAYTLPTLIVPPFGERLLLRYGARTAIPAGLFVIGAGFLLMWAGTAMGEAGTTWMLAGCMVAGAGLGLTNTPVTNTTTGAVPSARAGMASGIDMSARMISLAINIAVMGFILIAGIAASLRSAMPDLDIETVRDLAIEIASGKAPASLSVRVTVEQARHALLDSFGWVTFYGLASVWMLAFVGSVLIRSRVDGAKLRSA